MTALTLPKSPLPADLFASLEEYAKPLLFKTVPQDQVDRLKKLGFIRDEFGMGRVLTVTGRARIATGL